MIFQKFSTGVSMLQLNVELRVFDGTVPTLPLIYIPSTHIFSLFTKVA
jgi:hypothetical protein